MKIDFTKVQVLPELGAQPVEVDQRKDFSNLIYRNAKDIVAYNLALKIYNSQGEEDYTDEEVNLIKETIASITFFWQRKPLEDLIK